MNTNDQKPNTALIPMTERILTRIVTEQITPRGRLSFMLREWGIWCLWLVTVIIGALAVSVSVYVGMNIPAPHVAHTPFFPGRCAPFVGTETSSTSVISRSARHSTQ